MKRRNFMLTAVGAAVAHAAPPSAHARNVFIRGRDVTYEPDQPLTSTGLRIGDGLKLLRAGEKANTPPVLREEILDNPKAVFIIPARLGITQDFNGAWPRVPDRIEDLGRRVASLVFCKGTQSGGRTFIKPNMVGGLSKANPVAASHGGIVHPHFTAGLIDGLHDIGNENVAIGVRGALRHDHIVESGFADLAAAHRFPIIEAHLQYFGDYKKSELMWHENPWGMVHQRFCTYRPAFEKGTTFINLAHAHVHKVGHTTLTMKNLQGAMPRGYGHTCDAWTSLDIWRADLMDDFNRDYRVAIEESYTRHANMGYRYWDDGNFTRAYRSAGGYGAFGPALADYRKKRGDARQAALENLMNIADSRLFWAEMWSQRMMDIVQAVPEPAVSMVEGVFARGDGAGVVNADFVTVGKSMVAVDSVTSWLMGQDPRELPYLRIANERGLGQNDIDRIPVYFLTETGIERVKNPHILKRQRLGIYNYGIEEPGPRFW